MSRLDWAGQTLALAVTSDEQIDRSSEPPVLQYPVWPVQHLNNPDSSEAVGPDLLLVLFIEREILDSEA